MKAFWNRAAEDVEWFKKGDEILDTSRDPFSVWFPGHRTNTCFNCLDRHLQDRGDQNALIYDSPMADRVTPITYNELYHSVMSLAAFLKDTGIKKGSRVMIYMPNIPEAVIAMLATVRLGAIHCVVFDGFASEELAKRIVDCKPELIICASFGYVGKRVDHYKPKVDAAIVLASKHAPTPKCIVYNRLGGPEANMVPYRDYDWEEVMEKYKHLEVPCAVVSSAEPSYILYTSGTTGEPKGIVRDTGGHLVSLKWSMWNVYGLNPGDVIWTAR
jgi:propionyl-CoA synthetase